MKAFLKRHSLSMGLLLTFLLTWPIDSLQSKFRHFARLMQFEFQANQS